MHLTSKTIQYVDTLISHDSPHFVSSLLQDLRIAYEQFSRCCRLHENGSKPKDNYRVFLLFEHKLNIRKKQGSCLKRLIFVDER